MLRPFELRPARRAQLGSGAPTYRVVMMAVLLQLLAALVVLLVAPGSAASPAPLRPSVLPAGAPSSPVGQPVDVAHEPGAEPLPATPVAGGAPAAATAPVSTASRPPVAGRAVPGSPPELLPALRPPAASGPLRAVPAPDAAGTAPARTAAVRELLSLRGSAVMNRDASAFLSVVDPAASGLLARQAALFAALEAVPLSLWEYSIDQSGQSPPDPALDRAYGAGRWWAPRVVLSFALTGVDDRPIHAVQRMTFVERGGRWLLAAEGHDLATGPAAPRGLWDTGPVVAEQVDDVLVLGRPDDRALLREVATTTAAAVPRVTAAWGTDWKQAVVVLVPGSEQELAELMGSQDDLSQIAGLAIAELGDPELGEGPTGERIVLHPDVFTGLSPAGRRLVLTHELTHVATRRATGPAVPIWLAEGYADHVGYAGMSLPLSVTAVTMRADVRAGRLPERLPLDADFDPANPALAQAYEQAWLVVRLLAERHGQDGLLRFYRAVGQEREADPTGAVDRALRSELGTSTAQLTADWRAALQRDLG